MTNPEALTLEHPLDIDDARRASRRLAELRRAEEDLHEQRVREAVEAHHHYRKTKAKAAMVAEGRSAAEREAITDAEAADAECHRDLMRGLVKVSLERLAGLEGERSQLKSLIDWSARLAIDGRERRDGN